MIQDIVRELKKVKAASYSLSLLSAEQRNQVLQNLANKLRTKCKWILSENAKDLALMSNENPMYDRLLLTEERIYAIAADVENVMHLASPLGSLRDHKIMPNGLKIEKRVVPLGVVAVIFESRPNVTIDVFTLCFKAGNACILKGGKEAIHSNAALVAIILDALKTLNIDPASVYLLPAHKEAAHIVLQAVGLVDVCIPRGSQGLINFVRDHAKIPVIETGAGIVHIYFDASGDFAKGQAIINNAKTRRASVCNALDCLLIHESRINVLAKLIEPLLAHEVEIFADPASYIALQSYYPATLLQQAHVEDFGREFLSYKLAIKTVNSLEHAIQHIMQYTSGHSEAIITEDEKVSRYFLEHVDAAAVYVNASTAFTDGAQFGLGAEIGISTQKLHARGPMGLEALSSYKWVIIGEGQIRA
jgi:glutamate-5-semialdehyde dehydrogenase